MAEKEKQEALLSENNYRLLDEIRRQQTALIKQSFPKHRDSLGRQSAGCARSCGTEITWQKTTCRFYRPWDICWALPLVRVRSK